MHSLHPLPLVAIIGRSNVGKSTLFNKIAEQNRALVLPQAGTTRDRLEARVNWQKKSFILADTGGLDPRRNDPYAPAIISQSRAAQKAAAVLILVVDAATGPTPEDRAILRALKRAQQPVILAANKCDNNRLRAEAAVFEKFGRPLTAISAKNGVGVGDLLDAVTDRLKTETETETGPDMELALIGKPNVGKSSLLNALYGEERMIVSPLPHTTRDSQDVLIKHQDHIFRVTDTAGIRRLSHQGDEIETLSINKAREAARRADVVGLVIDISQPITSQDKRLTEEIVQSGRGIFIIANKWDAIDEKTSHSVTEYQEHINRSLPFLSWAPVLFVSVFDKQRIRDILDMAWAVKRNAERALTDDDCREFLKKILAKRAPTIGQGTRRPKLLRLEQVSTGPPRFLLTIPVKTRLAENYKQFMINALRKEYALEGVSIRLGIKEDMSKPERMLPKTK